MTAIDTTVGPEPARGLWSRLYRGETTFDFVGRRKVALGFSAALILISLLSVVFRQLNLGIDFEGGVAWEFTANSVTNDQAETILTDNGINTRDAKIQTLGGDRLRIQVGDQTVEVADKVRTALAEASGSEVSESTVSPTWGREISKKALTALLVFFVVLSIYISWRFEWKMAIAAIVAVVHDVLITVGIYSVVGFEVTPATVIAFLTILGFSLYDTIVVFDKVHENTAKMGARTSYGDIVNLSMNQVLMRSLNTSLAAVLPVLSILIVGSWILGAIALQDFALALLIGLLTGSYSSIFVATPVLAMLKERETKYRNLRDRASKVEDLVRPKLPTTAKVMPGAAAAPVTPEAILTHPPRPRKKRRR